MTQATCIHKFRDKTGKIIGYKLQDANGTIIDISASEVKTRIYSGELNIDNLTLI